MTNVSDGQVTVCDLQKAPEAAVGVRELLTCKSFCTKICQYMTQGS